MVNMSLIAKQLLIVWRRCFDYFKVVVIKANIVLIYANIVDSIFRYVCLKYWVIKLLEALSKFMRVSREGLTLLECHFLRVWLPY